MLGFTLPAPPALETGSPFEKVKVDLDAEGTALPESFRPYVMVDSIHDGNQIPAEYLSHAPEDPWEELQARYAEERDWGASLVAGYLASALHLDGYHRVNTARVLLDFDRFPGVTPKDARRQDRCAIQAPFDTWLTFEQQRRLLESHYDAISHSMRQALTGRRIKIAVHTYDPAPGEARPLVSLITKAKPTFHTDPAHGRPSHTLGPFDPLFPPELLESTADRLLRARLTLTLEEHGISVENNATPLSMSSVEVRSVVWRFFQVLRQAYETSRPSDPERFDPRGLVWEMLTDTSLRSGTAVLLRATIHQLRRPPSHFERVFEAALREYERIRQHAMDHREELVAELDQPEARMSVLVLEVRKDLVWNGVGGPFGAPRYEAAKDLARVLAKGIHTYLADDRPELLDAVGRPAGAAALRSVAE